MINENLNKKIKSIELSYLFSKNLDHGINKGEEWKLFEPSKFIYSFFALNMLYEIDWSLTFSGRNKLAYYRDVYAHTKLFNTVEFLYESDNNLDFYEEYKIIGAIEKLIVNSTSISEDHNITRENNCEKILQKDTFLNNYRRAINNFKNSITTVEDHYNLLAFTYQIRNNIFHGEKTVEAMTLKDQRERIVDYTNIVLTTLEMFFSTLETSFGYRRAKTHELNNNII